MEGVAARVRLYVLDHMILADEAFTAHLAHEGFLASVQTHMASQVRLVVELFGAEWAFVGLIAGVLLLVLAEQFRILEALAAHVAFEWFVTFVERVVVLRQVAHPIEGFVTLGALEGAHCVASVAGCSGHCHPFGHHWNGRRLGITGVELVTGQRRVLARQFRIAFQHVHQVVLAVLHTVVVVVVIEVVGVLLEVLLLLLMVLLLLQVAWHHSSRRSITILRSGYRVCWVVGHRIAQLLLLL